MKYLMDVVKDEFYPVNFTTRRVRETTRGIIYNDNGEIFLNKILCDDDFGHRDHFETPGGGLKNGETHEQGLRREIREELGYEIDNIEYIGSIGIEYNVIARMDMGHFYLAHATNFVGKELEDYEKEVIEKVVLVPMDEIVELYETYKPCMVGTMIHKRDLCAIKEALKLLGR